MVFIGDRFPVTAPKEDDQIWIGRGGIENQRCPAE